MDAFIQAIASDLWNAQAYVRRVKLYTHLFSYEQALADYIRALELEPENDEVHQLLEEIEQGVGYPLQELSIVESKGDCK